MQDGIVNAVIKSARIIDPDRGFLDAYLDLDYGGCGQGFGGWVLYLPVGFKHHTIESHAGHFIWRCMEIAGVSRWDMIPGKTVRVKVENGLAVAIGHIIKDDWFEPSKDFAKKAEAA